MAVYMLDTDISSYIMKRSNTVVLQRLQQVAYGEVCISAITHSELLFGVEISPRRQRDQEALDGYVRQLPVLVYGNQAALHYAQIRADLRRSGAMIGANDLLIAAHARSLELTLVTNNVREFGRVPGLSVENWTEPAR